jgi:acetolactate synthase-1/3 small subunit
MRHILAALVQNQPGVLTRVSGLFSRRGYNIESLAVGRTHEPGVSRITILVDGDGLVLEQVVKQLDKLVDVIDVRDITAEEHVDRELVLIKVEAAPEIRGEIMQIVDIFRARIVDIGQDSLIIECTGDHGKIRAIENSLKPFGILELVRTGKIAMVRGPKYGEVQNSGGK